MVCLAIQARTGGLGALHVRSITHDTDAGINAFDLAVRDGIAAADAGQTIPLEAVRLWLQSWGTEAELPPPCAQPSHTGLRKS